MVLLGVRYERTTQLPQAAGAEAWTVVPGAGVGAAGAAAVAGAGTAGAGGAAAGAGAGAWTAGAGRTAAGATGGGASTPLASANGDDGTAAKAEDTTATAAAAAGEASASAGEGGGCAADSGDAADVTDDAMDAPWTQLPAEEGSGAGVAAAAAAALRRFRPMAPDSTPTPRRAPASPPPPPVVDKGLQAFVDDFQSRVWITYRRGFPNIGSSTYTTDAGWGQGLTLVHFLAQPELFEMQKEIPKRHIIPQNTSYIYPEQPLSAPPISPKAPTLSQKVDECKPLAGGAPSAARRCYSPTPSPFTSSGGSGAGTRARGPQAGQGARWARRRAG